MYYAIKAYEPLISNLLSLDISGLLLLFALFVFGNNPEKELANLQHQHIFIPLYTGDIENLTQFYYKYQVQFISIV